MCECDLDCKALWVIEKTGIARYKYSFYRTGACAACVLAVGWMKSNDQANLDFKDFLFAILANFWLQGHWRCSAYRPATDNSHVNVLHKWLLPVTAPPLHLTSSRQAALTHKVYLSHVQWQHQVWSLLSGRVSNRHAVEWHLAQKAKCCKKTSAQHFAPLNMIVGTHMSYARNLSLDNPHFTMSWRVYSELIDKRIKPFQTRRNYIIIARLWLTIHLERLFYFQN